MPHTGVYIAPFGWTITKDGGGVQKKPARPVGCGGHLWPFRPSGCAGALVLTRNGRLLPPTYGRGHLFPDHDGGRIGVAANQTRHD